MATILVTGFPGFLGSALLPKVLARLPGEQATCLVQTRWMSLARERLAALAAAHPMLAGRVHLVDGDITQPDLGLRDSPALADRVVEIFHLAAVYDLSVGRDLAMRVNVEGTRHLLAFAARCRALRRLHYVSTCYVSGRYPGRFTEDMLAEGQSFNNHYEETKYLAELEVQRAMRDGLPATIYRPSVVVGDSVSTRPETRGGVFALADPQPLTVDEILREPAKATGRTVIRLPLPRWLAKGAIDHLPGVGRLLRIPSSAVDYFDLPTTFDTRHAQQALAAGGIHCPPFRRYVSHLVRFMRAHGELGPSAMT